VILLKPLAWGSLQREADGFALRIMPTGSMTWLYIYSVDGKRREMSLGTYPDISLAKGRELHADAKKLLAKPDNAETE
jgi:hypothetical protein